MSERKRDIGDGHAAVLDVLAASHAGGMLLDRLLAESRAPQESINVGLYYGTLMQRRGGKVTRIELSPLGWERQAAAKMRNRLESIVSAAPQSPQAEWMIETAREGLTTPYDEMTERLLTSPRGSGEDTTHG